jgi:hypothetical protein
MTTTLDLQVSPRLKRPGCRRRDFDALDARACADNGPRSPACRVLLDLRPVTS